MKQNIFLLDPGHGTKTPGKRSPAIPPTGKVLFEGIYVRAICAEIVRLCRDAGIATHMIVTEESDVSLIERVRRANSFIPPDNMNAIYVSVHGNAAGDGVNFHPATGFEVFSTKGTTKSDIVAQEIALSFQRHFPDHKHRVDTTDGDLDKEENFYVIRATKMPAVLTENEFFTNQAMAEKMLTKEFVTKVAQAHVDAFAALKGKL